MIRFLYGCVCLVSLLILGASLTGWVYSDRVPAGADATFASHTCHLRNYAVEGRHAHGLATLLAGPDVGDNAPIAMPTTQPIDQMPTRWQLGPAKFTLADTAAGRVYYAQAPYWLLAAVAALPLLLWLAL